jgi:hypothetical protein
MLRALPNDAKSTILIESRFTPKVRTLNADPIVAKCSNDSRVDIFKQCLRDSEEPRFTNSKTETKDACGLLRRLKLEPNDIASKSEQSDANLAALRRDIDELRLHRPIILSITVELK